MSTNALSARQSQPAEVRTKQFHETEQKPRPVLGSINQNVQNRVQPFRAAKQKSTTEGFFTKTSQNIAAPTFKIFEDPSGSQLHPALTSLPAARPALAKISEPRLHDSPMVLDVSEEERLNVFDIDEDAGIFGLSEYATEIFQHLREAEQLHRCNAKYMRKQQDITVGMRAILVDWLVEVADEYKLHSETTHLAVNYIDRFLSHMAVFRGKLQLVGAAAMFLAAKFEEIYPPDVGEFVYITDDTYTKKQVLRMEHLILKVLHFDVAVPTSNQFIKRFVTASAGGKKVESLAQYLCELSLVEYDCLPFLPSTVAASAVALASYTIHGKIWDDAMAHYLGYELCDLVPCIKRLHELFTGAATHQQQALFEKYKEAKFDCVAKLSPPLSLPFDSMDAE